MGCDKGDSSPATVTGKTDSRQGERNQYKLFPITKSKLENVLPPPTVS